MRGRRTERRHGPRTCGWEGSLTWLRAARRPRRLWSRSHRRSRLPRPLLVVTIRRTTREVLFLGTGHDWSPRARSFPGSARSHVRHGSAVGLRRRSGELRKSRDLELLREQTAQGRDILGCGSACRRCRCLDIDDDDARDHHRRSAGRDRPGRFSFNEDNDIVAIRSTIRTASNFAPSTAAQ